MKSKVLQSLTIPPLVMGVPREVFWINFLVTMDCMYFGAIWLLGFSIGLHLLASKLTTYDPDFFLF